MASTDRLTRRDDRARPPGPVAFHQILIILFGALLLGGGADLEDRIEDAVPEGERRERALELAREFEAQASAQVESFVESLDAFYTEAARPGRSRGDIQASLDDMVLGLDTIDRGSVQMLLDLRGVIDESEWAEVFPE